MSVKYRETKVQRLVGRTRERAAARLRDLYEELRSVQYDLSESCMVLQMTLKTKLQ